jgi:CRP-like cAMP-binding protein
MLRGRREIGMDGARLDGMSLFDGLSKKQRQFVAQHADEVDVEAGVELCHEGSLAWEFFVIETGQAEVRQGTQAIRTLGAGDFFGEIGVLSPDKRRTASVVTTTPMTAVVMTSQDLAAIRSEMPDVAERIRSTIAERTRALA